jgi:hypothetical protein
MAGHSKAQIVSAIKAAFEKKQLPDLENGAMAFMMAKSAYLGVTQPRLAMQKIKDVLTSQRALERADAVGKVDSHKVSQRSP